MKEYQIELSSNKKAKSVSIELSGCLNVTNILDIKKEINSAIKSSKKIELKIIDIEDADLTIVQLLVALQQKSKASKVNFKVDFNLNNEATELLKRAGFSKIFN